MNYTGKVYHRIGHKAIFYSKVRKYVDSSLEPGPVDAVS